MTRRFAKVARDHGTGDAGQRIFVVRREDYVYLVPFVEGEHTIFLKTNHPEPEGHEGVPR